MYIYIYIIKYIKFNINVVKKNVINFGKKIFFLPQDIYGFVFQETYIYTHTVYIQSKYNDMENKYE